MLRRPPVPARPTALPEKDPAFRHAALAKRLAEEQARNRAAQRAFHKIGKPITKRP